MWKRILVLVLFLFGVFWWLSHRDDTPNADTVNPDSEIEVSVNEAGDDDDDTKDSNSDDEDEDDEEDSDEAEEDTVVKTAKEIIAAPVEKVTTKVTEVASQPVVTAPVYVRPEPKPEPVPDVTTNAKVYLYEWGLDMSTKTFPAGTVMFSVQNDGRFTHEFEVEGKGNLGKVTPSMTETFSVELQPGTYEVYSPRREDRERGVADVIVVE